MAPHRADMTAEELPAPGVPGPLGEVRLMPEVGLNLCSPQVTQLHTDTPGEECTATTDSEEPFCRICHEDASSRELLSLCECCGSLAGVHRACLEHWLTASKSSHCELCHHQFALKPKRLTKWLCCPSVQKPMGTLTDDLVLFLFVMSMAVGTGLLSWWGATMFFNGNQEALQVLIVMVACTVTLVSGGVACLYPRMIWSCMVKRDNERVRLQTPVLAHSRRTQQCLSINPSAGRRKAPTKRLV